MEFLYKNKLILAVAVGICVGVVYFKYVNGNATPSKVSTLTDEDLAELSLEEKNEIIDANKNSNKNKDNALYAGLMAFGIIFGGLYMTEDKTPAVFNNIHQGEPNF